MSISELEKRIDDPQTLIIDMRGIFGYAVGHIKNSVCITDYLLTDMIESGNVFPKDKTIIMVCRVGELSPRYAAFLKRAGYTAYSLEGGVTAWRAEGKELVKE